MKRDMERDLWFDTMRPMHICTETYIYEKRHGKDLKYDLVGKLAYTRDFYL